MGYNQVQKQLVTKLGRFFLLIASIAIGACTQTVINPLKLEVLPSDMEKAKFPPLEEELLARPRLVLPLIVYRESDITDSRFQRAFDFLQLAFKQYGSFSFISLKRVEQLLKRDENIHFQAANVADAIELAKKQDAPFVVQLGLDLLESERIRGVDHFKVGLDAGVIATHSGQVVFKGVILMDTRRLDNSRKKVKEQIQKNFPLKGYILETRGGHKVARVSIGRSGGLSIGRELLIRERTVRKVMVNGLVKRTVSFASKALAKAKVIEVHEDYAWIFIENDMRDQIRVGQVVFTTPEKGFW